MFNCEFQPDNNKFKCIHCGTVVPIQDIKSNCVKLNNIITNETNTAPSFTRKLLNFSKAVVKYVKNGMKHVPEDVLLKRLDICKDCPYYKTIGEASAYCSHSDCGCNIKNSTQFLNKLSWASEKCPINKWGVFEV